MVIIPYVCAEFRDREGKSIYRTTPEMLRTLVDVPEDKWKAMQEDNLLAMLMADGSIKTPETVAQQKLLEKEPMLGMTAEGRSVVNASGVQDGGAEISRNERAVRGTVAMIEAADRSAVPEQPEKPEKPDKPTKADEKPAGAEQKK